MKYVLLPEGCEDSKRVALCAPLQKAYLACLDLYAKCLNSLQTYGRTKAMLSDEHHWMKLDSKEGKGESNAKRRRTSHAYVGSYVSLQHLSVLLPPTISALNHELYRVGPALNADRSSFQWHREARHNLLVAEQLVQRATFLLHQRLEKQRISISSVLDDDMGHGLWRLYFNYIENAQFVPAFSDVSFIDEIVATSGGYLIEDPVLDDLKQTFYEVAPVVAKTRSELYLLTESIKALSGREFFYQKVLDAVVKKDKNSRHTEASKWLDVESQYLVFCQGRERLYLVCDKLDRAMNRVSVGEHTAQFAGYSAHVQLAVLNNCMAVRALLNEIGNIVYDFHKMDKIEVHNSMSSASAYLSENKFYN